MCFPLGIKQIQQAKPKHAYSGMVDSSTSCALTLPFIWMEWGMLLNARGKEDPRSHWTTSQVSTISRYTRIPEHKIYFNFSGQDTYYV